MSTCLSFVVRLLVALSLEVVALVLALPLLVLAVCCAPPVDAIRVPLLRRATRSRGQQPKILLLHGSGFNWTEWIVGLLYLTMVWRRAVYVMNYAGLVSNERGMGMDDYAQGPVRKRVQALFVGMAQSEARRLVIIGHSMGGLIGQYYVAHVAALDSVEVVGLYTIASPWRGSPLLARFPCLRGPKRYQQMAPDSVFLQQQLAMVPHGAHHRFAGSSVDLMVPEPCYSPTGVAPDARCSSHWLGHYAQIASPFLWHEIGSWLSRL